MLQFGSDFAKSVENGGVIELIGDVGAGKTTFTRGLAKGLGITKDVTSPSFTISKSYICKNGKTFTHYDFYRLTNPGLMKEDLEEKIADGGIVVVEWGNSIADILPENRTIINIELKDNGREVKIDKHNRMEPSSARFVAPVVTGLLANSLPVGREMPQKAPLRLYLDTSTPTTILKLNEKKYEWDSGRDLAENLLKFIHDKLNENGKTWQDINEIVFMSGPGSFTGLRIGAAVVNTLAHELNIPLRNHKGETVKIIVPDYGRAANISSPRK